MGVRVVDNPGERRFETVIGGQLARLDYRRRGGTVVLEHVIVPESLEGRGVAAELTRTALDAARSQGLRVVPHCSYIVAWLRRHPEYADLVDAD